MASYSLSTKSYTDVHQAFEAAGALGQITLEFETSAKATVWAGRANAYRVLLRRQNEAAGREHACEFDHLMVRRPKNTNSVTIEPRGFNFKATGPDGEPIDFSRITIDQPVKTPAEQTAAEKEAEDFLRDFEEGKLK